MLVTKAMATHWLANTTRQRRVNEGVVRRYASDMAAGRWVADASPAILITSDDSVVDGQHRLHALLAQSNGFVLESEVKVVSESAIEVIDTGKPRSLADTLSVVGFDFTKELSAIFYQSVRWANPSLAARETPRTVQLDLIRGNPNIQKAAEVTAGTHYARHTGTRLPTGVIGSLWDMAQYGEGGDEVLTFVGMMHEGRYETDLLRRFAEQVTSARNPRTRLTISPSQLALLTARVYGAWLTDENPQKLYARRSALHMLPGFGQWSEAAYRATGDAEE